MSIIKNIVSFFRNLFNHEEETKMINAAEKVEFKENNNEFINSLKSNVVSKKNKKVETLISVGDGLGIQKKISY